MSYLLRVVGSVAALLALPSGAASAACSVWDVSNQSLWGAKQSNGYVLGFTFQQHDRVLSGTAYYYPAGYSSNRTGGTIKGIINGDRLDFSVSWGGGSKGLYTGFIASNGTLSGNTRDAKNRNSRATWYAAKSQKARCVS
jgi:hypothetical protein